MPNGTTWSMPSSASQAGRSEIGRTCGSGIAACRRWTSPGLARATAERRLAVATRRFGLGGDLARGHAARLELSEPEPGLAARGSEREISPLPGLPGAACPSFIFANEEDYAYGRFLLDSRSRDAKISSAGN